MNSEAAKSDNTSTETIHLRLSPSQKALIGRAAKVQGRSRNRFIVETACREAQTVLLDQTHFVLDEVGFQRFTEIVEAPPQPNPGLARLLARKAVWEK